MNKNEFALTLLKWIKDTLVYLGIDRNRLNEWDDIIFLIIIIIISFLIGIIVHKIILHSINKILKYKKIGFFQSLMNYNAIKKLSNLIPPLILSGLLPFAFDNHSSLFIISEKITGIYFLIALIFSTTAISKSVCDVLMKKQEWQNKPMKGFVELFEIIFISIIVIIIISILINKSPLNLITGLGAFAAVLMLIFKDTIVGFVSGVLLSENDMIHIGDWIEIPGTDVNGIVMDISLNTVKIQNFDNTIATVPPSTLISSPLINWRGMAQSGGRRIMRGYTVKLDYIKKCTPEFLEKMKGFDSELSDYITAKQKQSTENNIANTDNPAGLVNGTIDTNAGLFRAYMTMYIRRHPFINKELLFMVRTLAPTENGLPIQIYCFSSNKNWPSYESIQSDIMEHFVSVLPYFELYPFQNAGARDYIISGMLESNKIDMNLIKGVPWNSIDDTVKTNKIDNNN